MKVTVDFRSNLSTEYLSYENFNFEIKRGGGGAHAH